MPLHYNFYAKHASSLFMQTSHYRQSHVYTYKTKLSFRCNSNLAVTLLIFRKRITHSRRAFSILLTKTMPQSGKKITLSLHNISCRIDRLLFYALKYILMLHCRSQTSIILHFLLCGYHTLTQQCGLFSCH
jgi:hypothetical protein